MYPQYSITGRRISGFRSLSKMRSKTISPLIFFITRGSFTFAFVSPSSSFSPRTRVSAGDFFSDDEKDVSTNTATRSADYNEEEQSIDEMEAMMGPFDEHLPKLNSVTLVGRVGNEPEPKYFDDGKVVLNLSLACKRKYHPLERKVREIKSGEEETDWFSLEIWGRDAEYVANYVDKGARMGITGSLVQDSWIDKVSGGKRRKAKIVVRQVDVLESRAEAELRKSNRGLSSGRQYDDEDDNDGPRSAGTGGFFS